MTQEDPHPLKPNPPAPREPSVIPGERARQGRIILATRGRRLFFILGLAGAVLLAVVFLLVAGGS